MLFPRSNLEWKTLQLSVFLCKLHVWKNFTSQIKSKCFHPIRLQDSLTINISGMNASISLIFCMEWFTKERLHPRLFFLTGRVRHAQLHPSLPRLAVSVFGWIREMSRLEILQNVKLISFLGNNSVFFHNVIISKYQLKYAQVQWDCRIL